MSTETVQRVWYRPMRARHPDEAHRAATPLELLFDLCFVVAVSQAATGLHHALAENESGHGVLSYTMMFFAIWWAWMNFTWFASAYDTDDVPYRATSMVQIVGALVLAAGVPRAMGNGNFGILVAGYVIMRLAMVTQWLRAARSDRERRQCALRYAAGITVMQILWVGWLWIPHELSLAAFAVFVIGEIAVPVVAERSFRTTWHPGHITERYGLFTLIVLGEAIFGITTAVGTALDASHHTATLLALAGSGLLIVFSMWWLYFDHPAEDLLTSLKVSIRWGYSHLLIFASIAAVSAGVEVAVDHDNHVTHISALTMGYATALPVAIFLIVVWFLHLRPRATSFGAAATAAVPVAALFVLCTPFSHAPVQLTAAITAAVVIVMAIATRTGKRFVSP